VGFKTADDLAMRLGLPRHSPLRARAAVRFVLQEFSSEGHVGYPEPGVVDRTIELTEIPPEIILGAIEAGRVEDEFIRDQPPQPFEPFGNAPWLYIKPLFLSELGTAQALRKLREGAHPLPKIDVEAALGWVEKKMAIELAPSQREAIKAATQEKVLVITGGPGVGKTTIVRGLIEIFAAKRLRVALAAPTGRAAKRLSESTQRDAKTIHRLLEFDPGLGDFKRDARNPLDVDLLVVDEASMMDVTLTNTLLRAVPPWCCLVLVGDVDQLPSVGPGSVLADVIESGVIKVVRLTEIFRQAGQSYIVRAAHAVNHGEVPDSAPAANGDFYFIEADEPPIILDRIVEMLRERILKRFGLDPLRDVQILSPMNPSELGVRNLNVQMQVIFNPPSPDKPQIDRYGWTFRAGDKVLQLRNNYQKEVYNGDIGRIAEIYPNDQELVVDFDGKRILYDFAELDELTLAFAITIHKSQGTEYPAVIIPLHTQHFVMLQRNLLYTGITRGKKLVVLVGSRKALWIAVKRQDTAKRFSLLKWRLQDVNPLGERRGVSPT
jgi:exodeoxyribonuclease V alpha subunit